MSAPVTAGDRAREVLARVAAADACLQPNGPICLDLGDPVALCFGCALAVEQAAEQVKALTEAGLLVESVERVEWGVALHGEPHFTNCTEDEARRWAAQDGGKPIRRTRTTYPDRVTEWEEVE